MAAVEDLGDAFVSECCASSESTMQSDLGRTRIVCKQIRWYRLPRHRHTRSLPRRPDLQYKLPYVNSKPPSNSIRPLLYSGSVLSSFR